MNFWVGVTDNNWYNFLRQRQPDEVNFWRPSGRSQFSAVQPGDLFLFKLKSPYNHIAGGGYFVRHSILPLSLAWEAFKEKNGAPNPESLLRMISALRNDSNPNPFIGCSILTEPFFFSEQDWIPAPANWGRSIVQGKTYSTEDFHGMSLWRSVMERLQQKPLLDDTEASTGLIVVEDQPQYGSEYLTKARLGQGAFRVLVTESYQRRCAVTGERTLPVLEAAHIKPFAQSGPNRVNNGLLLRSDLHILFDRGYMTITDSMNVEVSRRIKEEFENGRDYYAMHGKPLIVIPSAAIERPAGDYIAWHNENIFRP
jgi:putative restriction endonuclease